MGRKKGSHKFRLLDNTRDKQGKLESLPRGPREAWYAPKWLGEDAVRFHRTYFPICKEMGTLSEADKDRWFLVCQRYHRILGCERTIDEHGLVVKGRGNELKRNPAHTILKAELDIFRSELDNFGLGFEARAKMGLKIHDESKDVMAKMID